MADPQSNQEIWDEYPELFHYTSPAGLDSILRTQALWATEVGFLNDTTEFGLLHHYPPGYLLSRIEKALIEGTERSIEYREKLEHEGGTSKVVRSRRK